MRISDWSSDVCSSDLQHAAALRKIALDLGVAAEALRLLAHVEHRQAEPFGDPRREGDAGGLATGDAVDRLVAGLALNQRAGELPALRAVLGRAACRERVRQCG